MSYPTFIAKGTKAEGNGSSVAPTYMAGINAYDLLFIQVINVQGTVGSVSCSATLISEEVFAWGTTALFYQIATGSETGTLTVNRSGSSGGGGDFMMAQIYQYRGSGSAFSIEESDPNSALSSTITWDAVVVGSSLRTLAAFVADYDGSGVTGPSGYTTSATDSSVGVSGMTLALFTKENVSSDGSVTGSGSANGWGSWHISLYNIPSGTRSFIVN